MDAFSGYNQIWMASEDDEKTSLITDQGFFCYRIMLFGLKNVGATYQQLVNKLFKEHIDRNIEMYVDDMLIKSRATEHHITDLQEMFSTLRCFQMKLNSYKYTFGVTFEKFLNFMVSQRGIEANLQKIQAFQDIKLSRMIKEV